MPGKIDAPCPDCEMWMKCARAELQDDGVVRCGRAVCGHRMTTYTEASDTEMRKVAETQRHAGTRPCRYKLPDYHTGKRHLAWVDDALQRTLTLEDDTAPVTAPHVYECQCAACQEFWRGWAQRFGFWGPWDARG